MANLLFVDKSLKSLDVFVNGCNNNTKCVIYDVNNDTFENLNEKVQLLGESSLENVGFVFEHGIGSYELFVENTPFITIGGEKGVAENLVSNFIKSIVDRC